MNHEQALLFSVKSKCLSSHSAASHGSLKSQMLPAHAFQLLHETATASLQLHQRQNTQGPESITTTPFLQPLSLKIQLSCFDAQWQVQQSSAASSHFVSWVKTEHQSKT